MAMWARRYQWEAGLTDEQLVAALMRIALDQRAYAQRNPAAVTAGRPLDEAGYRAGRMIATPLRVYDLALETDGAAAIVVAREGVGQQAPVWIRSAVQGLFPYAESISVYGELRNGPQYRALGARLLDEASIRPGDLVAASIYDATSISVLLGLEGFGLHPPGSAARAITETGIGLDSPLPVNTSGGHLSEAYVHGMNLVVEAVRLCRGESPNQVPRSGPVLVSSGPSAAVLSP
jgi:acetyl-CoA acetyltransferase